MGGLYKMINKSRSPFINLSRRLIWTIDIWITLSRYLYCKLYTYHDIDSGTDTHYNWLIDGVRNIGEKTYLFNAWWINGLARLFCRHYIEIRLDKLGDISQMYSYVEQNNPSRWFWIHPVLEEPNRFSSFRRKVVKVEISFMFKQEAIMYRLGKA